MKKLIGVIIIIASIIGGVYFGGWLLFVKADPGGMRGF